MPACQAAGADDRAFVVTPYVEGEGGRLRALVPAEGPCRGDGVPCATRVGYYRARKTGPEFPLAVVRCGTHARAFTVYPPGHVPYGRQRMAPVAEDGSAVEAEDGSVEDVYAATAFGAAIDAAAERAWSRQGGGPSWSSQGRWLARLLDGVGAAVELEERVRGRVAAALEVGQLTLREQAAAVAARPGYRSRGEAVMTVVMALGRGARVLERLLAAGTEVGLWGRALRWHPDTRQLRQVGFGAVAARGSPG